MGRKFNNDDAYFKCGTCGFQTGDHVSSSRRDKESGLMNECPKCKTVGPDGMVFYMTDKSMERFSDVLCGVRRNPP